MSTPLLSTYARAQNERRERQMQTAFPAKVLDWHSGTNTVRLEPQFIETWTTNDSAPDPDSSIRLKRFHEDAETTYIDNVPVLFPRSGSWSITFPIETGSFGLVVCTKYSLDAFRNQGNRADPEDLRRFTMGGAVFHPVNLYPNSSALSGVSSSVMELGQILTSSGASTVTTQFIALANLVKSELDAIQVTFESITVGTGGGGEVVTPYTAGAVASTSVKVSE